MDIMKKLSEFMVSKPIKTLILPAAIGAGSFAMNLMVALSDGNIDCTELHKLLSSANGIETIALIAVMYALKIKQQKP